MKPSRRYARWLPALLLALPACASAYTVNIANGPNRAIYLRVGHGAMGFNYTDNENANSVPTTNTITRVSVTVPGTDIGNGTALPMDGNSNGVSEWDGFAFCNAGEVYIGGFYRRGGSNSGSNTTAGISVTPQGNLSNGAGATIPWSQISWSISGNGDAANIQRFSAGTFTGAANQSIAVPARPIQRGSWTESCMRFSYENDAVVDAGTYTGRVTYTMSSP